MGSTTLRSLRRRRAPSGSVLCAAWIFAALGPIAAHAAPAAPDASETVSPASSGPAPANTPESAPEPESESESESEPEPEPELTGAARPPRLDGPYIGGMVLTGLTIPRVNGLDAGATATFGAKFRFGEMVLPWLGLGLSLGGAGGARSSGARQTLGQGQMLVDTTFVPLAKRRVPFYLRASFGFGGGAVVEEGAEGRAGYGGAAFSAAGGYTFFPWAKKRRAYRGGGFGLGPELGWLGFTPTGAGNPMSHTIYVALTTTFYFGS